MIGRFSTAFGFFLLGVAGVAQAALIGTATLYKNPQCPCCDDYVQALEKEGLKVEIKTTLDLSSIAKQVGMKDELVGCHTMFIGDYVIDGLVPLDLVESVGEEPQKLVVFVRLELLGGLFGLGRIVGESGEWNNEYQKSGVVPEWRFLHGRNLGPNAEEGPAL